MARRAAFYNRVEVVCRRLGVELRDGQGVQWRVFEVMPIDHAVVRGIETQQVVFHEPSAFP